MPPRVYLVSLVLILSVLACASPVSLVPSESVPDQPAMPQLPSATPFIAESYPTTAADAISPNQVVSGIDVRVDRVLREMRSAMASKANLSPTP